VSTYHILPSSEIWNIVFKPQDLFIFSPKEEMQTITLLLLIAHIMPTLTTPLPSPPLQPPTPSLSLPTPNLTTTPHQTQRRLPLHNALLNITTHPSLPLPSPLWRHVLAAAHLQTVTLHGDREIVQEPYTYHEGGCYFRAESMPGGEEEKRLTYGTLEEGIGVLAGFLGGVGEGLGAEGVFVEGRGGRAIGVMGIGVGRGGEGRFW